MPGRRSADEWGLRALLILLVVDIFIVAPMGQAATSIVRPVVHSIVVLSGIAIAYRSRGTVLVLVGVLGVVGLVTHWTYHGHPTIGLQRADTALSLAFTAIVTGLVLLQVVRAGPITAHRIEGAVAAYLLIAYAWALAYQLVALSDPSSFTFSAAAVPQTLRFRLLYFSVTTLTSVTYGDMMPLAPVVRCLAALEAVIGQLFPVLLLGRLVSMELTHRERIDTVAH